MAYADSASDLPMLEAVGFPVAVNPEAKLAAIARRRGLARRALAQGRRRLASPSCPSARSTAGARWRRGRTSPAALAGAARRLAAERADEVPGLRAERAPVRRLPGGVAASARAGARASDPSSCSTPSAPELPGRRLVPPPAAAVGHLRVGPGHPGRAQLALLRGHGQLPLRPRPRGRGRARRRRGRPRRPARWTRAPGPSSSRCSAVPPATSAPAAPTAPRATPGCAATWPSAPSSPGSRPASAPTPAAAGRPPPCAAHASQLHAVPDSLLRRGRRDGRAHGLRRPCRPVGRHRRRGRRGRGRCRHPRPGHGGRPRPPGPPGRPRAR